MSVWTILLLVLTGWALGGFANWAADELPGWKRGQGCALKRLRAFSHYWTLWWHPWRRVCPHCHRQRPWRIPLLEMVIVVSVILSGLLHGPYRTLLAIFWLYLAFLLTVFVIDFEHRRVLNIMLAPATIAVFLISFIPGTPAPFNALLGGVVGFGLFLLLSVLGRGALGAGDVKLAGLIGLMTGYPAVLTALVLGSCFSGVAALVLLLSRRATRKSYMAYAPYMVSGALVVLWQTLSSF